MSVEPNEEPLIRWDVAYSPEQMAAAYNRLRAMYDAAEARAVSAERERDELRAAATALRDDMLERAKMDAWQNDGDIIVEAGAGVWSRFNAVLDMPSPPTRQPKRSPSMRED